MKLGIGADHRGFAQKEYLKQNIQHARQMTWIDVGAFNAERSDYPLFAKQVAQLIVQQQAGAGILLCGSGIGMTIVANRYPGIYAGLAWNVEVARVAKEDDNINILVIPSDYVSEPLAVAMVNAWLNAHFKADHYQERINMIDGIK